MRFTRRGALVAAAAAGLAGCHPPPRPAAEGRDDGPGGRFWWKRVGSGSKTPILSLHGGPGAAHNYLHSLEALASDRQVIFYDQLGCGLADSPPDEKIYTVQRAVDELDAVRNALGLEKVILYGHSWGAMLAIEYLCQGRSRGVEKLILGGALASVPQASAGQQRLIDQLPDGKGARLHELEASGQAGTSEYQAIVDLFYKLHVCRVDPDPEAAKSFDYLARSIAYRVMNGPNEFTISGVIKDWDRRADLGRITAPTLITTGEFDEVTLDCHETIRDGIKGSQLQVFKDASHMTMVEKPGEYAAALRRFIA
ncbi:MAG TPA: proline iminopeptidase-family hydrolase [Phenylobacterium sp.]|nr:proline iminopeptidase-family hydrolase [Phenylobacterium sp.]